jgi:hypothetical protein
MILDQLAAFFPEATPLTLSTAANSAAVNVPALAGRLDPIHYHVSITASVAAGKTASVALRLLESDDEAFASPTELASMSVSLPAGSSSTVKFYDLPSVARKEWVKLQATAASNDSSAAIAIGSGFSMDVLRPYEAGQYRDKGKAVA